jgi:hypothetical protein
MPVSIPAGPQIDFRLSPSGYRHAASLISLSIREAALSFRFVLPEPALRCRFISPSPVL